MAEFTIRDMLFPKIEESFSDKNNVKKLLQYIMNYADSNSDILLTTNMTDRLIFKDADKDALYSAEGLDKHEVEAAIKASKTIKDSYKVATNPFYVASVLAMHYFDKVKMKDAMTAVSVYMGYVIYTAAHKLFFNFLPKREIMEYTVNNLSNRFLLKQVGTIQLMIEKTILNAMDGRFKSEVSQASDEDIMAIINALDTRISSVIKNIAKEFYYHHDHGDYLNNEEDNEDEDDFHLSDSQTLKVSRIVDTVAASIVRDGFDQNNVIQRAISLNPGASMKKLEPILRSIVEDDTKEIPLMITDIITIYILKSPSNTVNDLGNMRFLSESLQIYKSNAQDALTTRIKDRLIKWINMTSQKYGHNFISKGKTSMDTYRKSIYTCFVFKIMETIKK